MLCRRIVVPIVVPEIPTAHTQQTAAGESDVHRTGVAIFWEIPTLRLVAVIVGDWVEVAIGTIPSKSRNQSGPLLSGVQPGEVCPDAARRIPRQLVKHVDGIPVAAECARSILKLDIRFLISPVRSNRREEVKLVLQDRSTQRPSELVIVVFDLAILEISRGNFI